jgi:protein SCO1/2
MITKSRLTDQPSNHPSFHPSILPLLLLVALLLTACGAYQFNGTAYPEPQAAPDFELTAADGTPFRLSGQRGQIVLLFFGYTSCPDVCPTTLAEANQLLRGLGDDAGRVTYTFITVDPGRDTPQVLAGYTAAFHPAIVGLTGAPDQLAGVRQAYGVSAEEVMHASTGGHSLAHTARLFLVDAQGRLRLSYAAGTPAQDILQDIRHLLG